MTYQEVVEYLDVPVSNLRKWVRRRMLPVISYGHRTVSFDRLDLEAFKEKRIVKAIT